jgi:hypothetical protein
VQGYDLLAAINAHGCLQDVDLSGTAIHIDMLTEAFAPSFAAPHCSEGASGSSTGVTRLRLRNIGCTLTDACQFVLSYPVSVQTRSLLVPWALITELVLVSTASSISTGHLCLTHACSKCHYSPHKLMEAVFVALAFLDSI